MKEIFVMLNNNIRQLFRETSTWLGIIIILQLIIIWLIIYVYIELSNDEYHFYMNTKSSLETISNKKLDKYDGKLQRELTTEEEIIRKNNTRWHLRNFFK